MTTRLNITRCLATLNQVLMATGSNLTEIFRHVCPLLAEVVRADAFFAGTYDSSLGTIDWQSMNVSDRHFRRNRPEDDELIKVAIQQKETVYSNIEKKAIFSVNNGKEVCVSNEREVANADLIAPIICADKVVGILCAKSVATEMYSESEAHLLSLIARLISLKIEYSALKSLRAERNKLQSVVDLANSLGHELNQPLTGITGYCALIKEEMAEGDAVYSDIVEIEKQTARLESLIIKFQNLLQLENLSKRL